MKVTTMFDITSTNSAVEAHYTRGNLADAIRSGLQALGKDATDVTLGDLAPSTSFTFATARPA
jgi:hypothetical protein